MCRNGTYPIARYQINASGVGDFCGDSPICVTYYFVAISSAWTTALDAQHSPAFGSCILGISLCPRATAPALGKISEKTSPLHIGDLEPRPAAAAFLS